MVSLCHQKCIRWEKEYISRSVEERQMVLERTLQTLRTLLLKSQQASDQSVARKLESARA